MSTRHPADVAAWIPEFFVDVRLDYVPVVGHVDFLLDGGSDVLFDDPAACQREVDRLQKRFDDVLADRFGLHDVVFFSHRCPPPNRS